MTFIERARSETSIKKNGRGRDKGGSASEKGKSNTFRKVLRQLLNQNKQQIGFRVTKYYANFVL